jgi:hypothetical protein
MQERRRFEHEQSILSVREHENGPSVQEVSVGEPIVVDVKDITSASDVIKVRWMIPGRAVMDYVWTRKKTTLSELDLEQRSIRFFWVDAEKRRVVKARITRRSGSSEVTSEVVAKTFDVTAPTLDHFLAKTGSVAIERRDKLRAIRFGQVKGKHGVHWDWQVTLHRRHAGSIKDLQTIREDRRRIGQKAGKTVTWARRNPRKKDVHEQLDQSLWDAGTEAAYSTKGHYPPIELPAAVNAGKTLRNKTSWDSPHTSMEPTDDQVTVFDQFKYYILFKPDTVGSIWVPVAKAEWLWKATAVKGRPDWKLTDQGGKVTKKGALTLEFPSYESNVSENIWMEIPP